jgi:hypothetical protein
MNRKTRIFALGLLTLVLGLVPAWAGERAKANARPGIPPHYLANPPGAWFYPDSRQLYPPQAQISPVQAYPWGYFGARSKQFLVAQPGYYRDFRQTITPRGF